jgi:hypothetical protein
MRESFHCRGLSTGFCRVSAYQLPCDLVIRNKNMLYRACGLSPTRLSELASPATKQLWLVSHHHAASIQMLFHQADSKQDWIRGTALLITVLWCWTCLAWPGDQG